MGALTVALAALAALAIVATIKKTDPLSLVALAVAIVAFVVQILVFTVQAETSLRQDLRAQELYGSTMSLLSTIAEKAEGTRRDVNMINERMLGAILGKAISETVIASPSSSDADFGEIVAEKAMSLVGASIMFPDQHRNANSYSDMYTFPGHSEVERVFSRVESLNAYELWVLSLLGRDQEQFELGNRDYPGIHVPDPRHLIEKGFVSEERAQGRFIHMLTEDGRIAARLLLASEVPASEVDGVTEIRKAARATDRKTYRGGMIFARN